MQSKSNGKFNQFDQVKLDQQQMLRLKGGNDDSGGDDPTIPGSVITDDIIG